MELSTRNEPQMPRADALRTAQQKPVTWSGAWVRERLREACEIERRMPRQANGNSAAWPFPVVHTFAEMIAWDDARDRVWDQWARTRGAYPFEVSRMDEAFAWLSILREHPGERRCLMLWAVSSTSSLRAKLARRGWSRTTFYRKVHEASERIAAVLNARGVVVR